MLTIFLTVFTALIFAYKYLIKSSKNRPPGPPALPLIGSLPFLGYDMRKNLAELHKKYGPIFTFQMGPDNWMAICDFDLYKESMQKDEFQDRPSMGALADMLFPDERGDVRGVMFANGTEWQEQRRFLQRQLRDFGFGKIKMEPLIHEEIKKSIAMIKKELKDSHDNRLSLNLRLNVAILNSLWHLITGENFQYDDPKLKIVFDRINLFMTSTMIGGPITAFPWLKHVAPNVSGYTRAMTVFNDVLDIVKESYEQHLATFNKEEMRDFMDVFIKQIDDARKDSNSSFHGEKGMKNLLVNMVNLFVGGSDTTSSTLCWSLFHLSTDPVLQEKAIEEIEQVIGFDRLPSLEDRPNTPFLEAIVCETHRITSLAFAGIPRLVSKDTSLGGYFIEKDTRVMTGIWEIMHDEKYWDCPDNFRPERFLNDTHNKIVNIERLIPFGIGKRMCVGSSLAQGEIYLFLAGLIQNFKFEDPTPDKLEPSSGFVLGCPQFSLKVTPRF